MEADPTSDGAHYRRWQQDQAALAACYAAIDAAWRDSGIPALVSDTPDGDTGWRCLLDWVRRYDPRGQDQATWDAVCAASRPHRQAMWAKEIHIFSHMACPIQGHSLAHAALEAAGQRVILAWWQSRAAT